MAWAMPSATGGVAETVEISRPEVARARDREATRITRALRIDPRSGHRRHRKTEVWTRQEAVMGVRPRMEGKRQKVLPPPRHRPRMAIPQPLQLRKAAVLPKATARMVATVTHAEAKDPRLKILHRHSMRSSTRPSD